MLGEAGGGAGTPADSLPGGFGTAELLAGTGAGGDASQAAVEDSMHERLVRVWLNERAAPELLPHPAGILADVLEFVENQQAQLDTATTTTSADAVLSALLYEMELERYRYILRDFAQCRLRKVCAAALPPL